MTDRKNGALERATQRGALTKRRSSNLVSRGLADLERSKQAQPAPIGPEECCERGKRLYRDAEQFAPAERDRKYVEAVRWYRLAAEKGYAEAQQHLGFMYEYGLGVPQDDTEAVRWYRLAADRGHAGAQSALGFMYKYGLGVPQDDTEAVRWSRLAADQGHARAQYNLGLMYLFGDGVPQDDTAAVRWFRLAAEQGEASAQFNLGFMYAYGRGVSQDDVEAYMWFNLSAAQSFGEKRESCVEVRDNVAERMTSDQIAEAQRRAREWTPTPEP